MRSSDLSAALAAVSQGIAATVAPAVPIESLQTFTEAIRHAEGRATTSSSASSARLPWSRLLLATSGLFGVVSYTVAQRTAEFGTRMALGASAWDVVGLVARQSLGLAVVGLMVGLAGGVGVGLMMGSLLYGMSPWIRRRWLE